MNRLTCENSFDYYRTKNQNRKIYERLKYYEDLEETGTLVFYPRNAFFIKNKQIYKGWVHRAEFSSCYKPLYEIRFDDYSLDSYRGYLGNDVFYTKEEAEAKLKKLEDDKIDG